MDGDDDVGSSGNPFDPNATSGDGTDPTSTGASDPSQSGASTIDPSQIWIGLGVKGGGFLGIGGATSLNGYVWRLDQLALSPASFNVTEFQIGLGLGGSWGFSMLIALNTNNIYGDLNQSWSGWSPTITASVGEGIHAEGCASIIMSAGDTALAAIQSMGSLKTSELYNAAMAIVQGASGAQGLKPCWMTYDFPTTGYGSVQGSAGMSNSQLFITV